jgi:hypothetical protein
VLETGQKHENDSTTSHDVSLAGVVLIETWHLT